MRQKKILEVVVFTVNTTKDHTQQVLNTTGMKMLMSVVLETILLFPHHFWMRQKKILEVVVFTVNTTKDHTQQVLNTTGMNKLGSHMGIHQVNGRHLMRQKKMLVVVVFTVNTTMDHTQQVLNTTGMNKLGLYSHLLDHGNGRVAMGAHQPIQIILLMHLICKLRYKDLKNLTINGINLLLINRSKNLPHREVL